MSDLATIRRKVRLLTGRTSSNVLTESQIDDYVNTFYQYDVPETLRLFDLKSTFSFMTIPYVDTYDLSTMTASFGSVTETVVNVFTNLVPPVFISGYRSFFSESRDQFFNIYPFLHQELDLTGDGTAGPYTFNLPNIPALQNSVTVGTIDDTGANVQVVDAPSDATTGAWTIINSTTAVTGSIGYQTGAGTITFANAIPTGTNILVTWVPYIAARPQGTLSFNNVLTLRPVPDKQYLVTMDGYVLPTALLQAGSNPLIKQWWQYLAYGAAKKVFEDAADPSGLATILPELKHQQHLVLRKSIVQQTSQRTTTIYSQMGDLPVSDGFGWQNF